MKHILLCLCALVLVWCASTPPSELPSDSNAQDDQTTGNVELIPFKPSRTIKKVEIPSPVYTLTGRVKDGVTRVDINWTNANNGLSGSYTLQQFKSGDEEFVTNLRLDYGNIASGRNVYDAAFYSGESFLHTWRYVVTTNYNTHQFGEYTIYFDDTDGIYYWWGDTGNVITNHPLNDTGYVKPHRDVLLLTPDWYTIDRDSLIYNTEKNFLLKLLNFHPKHGMTISTGTLYTYSGDLLLENINFKISDPWWVSLLWFDYDPDKHLLTTSNWISDLYSPYWSVRMYNTLTKELIFSTRNQVRRGSIYGMSVTKYWSSLRLRIDTTNHEWSHLETVHWVTYWHQSSWVTTSGNLIKFSGTWYVVEPWTIDMTHQTNYYSPTTTVSIYGPEPVDIILDMSDLSNVMVDGQIRNLAP